MWRGERAKEEDCKTGFLEEFPCLLLLLLKFVLFSFLLAEKTREGVFVGAEKRVQNFSRNKGHGLKQSLAPISGQTAGGNGKRKTGCYCGFSLGGLFRSVDLQG